MRSQSPGFIGLVLFLMLAPSIHTPSIYAQMAPTGYETVIVTTNGWPVSAFEVNRDVIVLTREEIEKLPVSGISDLFQYINGFYLRARGPHGIQADASTRGGTYEQILVLVNGIPVNDPQTGHFNLNVPLSLEDIERIEISRGPSLHFYGIRAMGGLIQIFTRNHAVHTLEMTGGLGQYGRVDGQIGFFQGNSGFYHRLSITHRESDGYRPNTDYTQWIVNDTMTLRLGRTETTVFAGFFSKSFGANAFYTERFPMQWESNRGGLVTLSTLFPISKVTCRSSAGWRIHGDRFLLDRNDPSFYENRHTSQSLTLNLACSFSTALGNTNLGGEWTRDSLRSTLLGNRKREARGLYFLQSFQLARRATMNIGGILRHENNQWHFWPSLDVGYRLNDAWYLFVATGWSYRIPTFTELYYRSPANIGNPELQPEKAWSLEGGFRHRVPGFLFTFTGFYRRQQQVIDWVRTSSSEPWRAVNLGQIETTGFHVDMMKFLNWKMGPIEWQTVRVGYSHLQSQKDSIPYDSKYVLTQLDHQLLSGMNFRLFNRMEVQSLFRYEVPHAWPERWLMDVRLRYPMNSLTWVLDVQNVFNQEYETFPGVVMPGRWIFLGLEYRI